MKQVKTKLPIYTGDVSGVPSALYELSGMVVMHDASGCNSTYNTHDELRWYTKESLIFISGMNEYDAVLGNDKRLIQEIITAARQLKPQFVAICSTPVPFINGTDFKAITAVIEKELKIPVFYVPTNGMHTYSYGAGQAFLEFGKRFIKKATEKIPNSVNLLGITPLDYGVTGFEDSARKILKEHEFTVLSCLAMGDSFEQVKKAGKASANLVVSAAGMPLAEWMEKELGIPYVVGTFAGCFSETVCSCLNETIRTQHSQISYQGSTREEKAELVIVGEPVISESIAAAIKSTKKLTLKVISPIYEGNELLLANDKSITEEEELRNALSDAVYIAADPLLKELCKEDVIFYEMPHVACSGRIYANRMKDITKL